LVNVGEDEQLVIFCSQMDFQSCINAVFQPYMVVENICVCCRRFS